MTKPISRIVRFSGVVLLGLLVLISVTQLLFSGFHDRLPLTVYFAGWWACFWANLAVVCFASFRFNRTNDRAWLYVACAALLFFCSNLLEIVEILMRLGESAEYWMYMTSRVGDTVAMAFYAWGIVSLARRTKPIDERQPSKQSLEPTAGRYESRMKEEL